jgi:hypothetical protein
MKSASLAALLVAALAVTAAAFGTAKPAAPARPAAAPAAPAARPAEAPSAPAVPVPAPDASVWQPANTYALIVSGISKDPVEKQSQDSILSRLRDTLVFDLKIDSDKVTSLGFQPSDGPGSPEPVTAAALRDAVSKAASLAKSADRFIFYYRGQANVAGDTLRINLAGPDITHDELAAALSAITAGSVLIVLDCPGAGAAVKSLTGEGRIIVCGTRGDQPYSTLFSENFVPALTDSEADLDKDSSISLLEAYRLAVTRIEQSYQAKGLLQTENALLEDDGDGVPTHQPWLQTEEGFDGRAASQFFFGPRVAPGS